VWQAVSQNPDPFRDAFGKRSLPCGSEKRVVESSSVEASMLLTELRTKAMALRPEEREILAHALLDSIAGEPAEEIDEAWLTEIEQRMKDVEEGRVTLVSYDLFREEIRKKTGW